MATTAADLQIERASRTASVDGVVPLRGLRFGSDPEWLIGGGRLITAVFALIAVYIDPTKPAQYFHDARAIIIAYILFSLVVVLLPINRPIESKVHIFPHAVDIAIAAALAYLTDELTSPFFAFLPFTLLAATIRWGLVGSFVSGVILEIVMIIVGWSDLSDGHPEVNIVIMRSTYFVVTAMLLGYFGAYRKRSRQRFAELAAWPVLLPEPKLPELTAALLERAARILEAPLVLLLWRDKEAAEGNIAAWYQGRFRTVGGVSDDQWRRCADAGRRSEKSGLGVCALDYPFEPDLAAMLEGAEHCFGTEFSGPRFEGRLVVVDADFQHEELDSLTSIIASRISNEFERVALLIEVADAARMQERARLARDLHDSVLQDLTAANLHLQSTAAAAPSEIATPLNDIGLLLADQQSRIRKFVDQTRTTTRPAANAPLADLRRTLEELRRAWRCNLHLTIDPPDLPIPDRLATEVAQIVSEATSNAVRHGSATRVDFAIGVRGQRLQLAVSDDGSGIAPTPEGTPLAPLSLSSRVADLGGRLSITRPRPGVGMMIELPMP